MFFLLKTESVIMDQSIFTPLTLTSIAIVILLLFSLLFVPRLAALVSENAFRLSGFSRDIIASLWKNIIAILSFSDYKKLYDRNIEDKVRIELGKLKRSGDLPPFDDSLDTNYKIAGIRTTLAKLDPAPDPPTPMGIFKGWLRRIAFLFLTLIIAGFDFVFILSRSPLIFGTTIPGFIKPLLRYLAIFNGISFVGIAILAGLCIEEYTKGRLFNAFKIEPDISDPWRNTKYFLAVAMLAVDLITVLLVALNGAVSETTSTNIYQLLIGSLIGESFLLAVAIFLGGVASTQGAVGISAFIVGSIGTAIIGANVVALVIVGTILKLFANINASITRLLGFVPKGERAQRVKRLLVQKDVSVIGYGTIASNFVVGVCEDLNKLFGQSLWLAGISASTANNELFTRLRKSNAAEVSFEVSTNGLIPSIQKYFSVRRDQQKTLLIVVAGMDLADCLDDLKGIKGQFDTRRVKNVTLAILWLLPVAISNDMRNLAKILAEWAKEKDSLLATTIVDEASSALALRMGNQSNRLFERSMAALLGDSSRWNFTNILKRIKSRYPFVALASGSVGVVGEISSYSVGRFIGRRGEISPESASNALRILVQSSLTSSDRESMLSSVRGGKPFGQSILAVSFLVPYALPRRVIGDFIASVSSWLRSSPYDVNADLISVFQYPEGEHGIDISLQEPRWVGDYYLHFTAFFGIDEHPNSILQDLLP